MPALGLKKIMGSRKKFDDISSFLDIIHERKYVTDRSTDRTDGRTDKTARQQRPRLRIASRGKKRFSRRKHSFYGWLRHRTNTAQAGAHKNFYGGFGV